jgi:hypothetical protein
MISHAVLENADLPEGIKRPAEVAPEGEPVAKRSEPSVDGDDPEHVPPLDESLDDLGDS